MKKNALAESKVLKEVRRIKEEIAREAESDPGYYQRLNGLGARLLPKLRVPQHEDSPSSAYVLHDKPSKKPVR